MTLVAVSALLVSVVALLVAVVALVTLRGGWRRGADADALPQDVAGLRREVADLKAAAPRALRHLAVVRYDAFGDMGGHLSWSVALLDDRGDGVVLTSITGRSEARTYAKPLSGGTSEQQLSPEEREAIHAARP